MRNYLAVRLDAITDAAKFAALFLAAVAAMFLMTACGPSQDTPAPVANNAPTHAPQHAPETRVKIPRVCLTDRLTSAGKLKCADAYKVPAYTWTNDDGSQGSDPGGAVDVPEILGDTGISDAELPFVLDGVLDGYDMYANQNQRIPV